MLTWAKDCNRTENVSRKDALIGAGLTIGAALVVAAIMVLGRDPVAETIGLTMTPAVLVIGWQTIHLRSRSWRAKLLLIGGPLLVSFLIGLAAGLAVNS